MLSPALQTFFTASPVTFTDSLNPFASMIVDPTKLNLAFQFNSDSSFKYSYSLTVSGLADGSFLLYDDIEAAAVPEPASLILLGTCAILLAGCLWRNKILGK